VGAEDFAAEDLVGDEVLARERACPLFDSRDSLGVPSSAWSAPPPGLAAVLDQTHDDVALGLFRCFQRLELLGGPSSQ
jgi:hypothetical protein